MFKTSLYNNKKEFNLKQLFLSHNWGKDNLNRDNHYRVKIIGNILKKNGYTIWLDEFEIKSGNIDHSMLYGINNCECVLVFITDKYMNKINNGCENKLFRTDNCYKEFNYSNIIKKTIIPILMEPIPELLEKKGLYNFYLGNQLYIDFSNDFNYNKSIKKLIKSLKNNNIYPKNIDNKFNILSKKKNVSTIYI
tara:strand:+ start:692 stop:1270 length:579 start_codon:yes stop_codon:yes gene_type:complete